MFNYGTIQSSKFPGPETILTGISPRDAEIKFRIPAIIDSGSVLTGIPSKHLDNLKITEYRYQQVAGPIGKPQTRRICIIDIDIANIKFVNVEVIPIDKPYAIVGRNIINHHRIALDAKQLIWEVL
jgi:hypothetical protein